MELIDAVKKTALLPTGGGRDVPNISKSVEGDLSCHVEEQQDPNRAPNRDHQQDVGVEDDVPDDALFVVSAGAPGDDGSWLVEQPSL